MDTKILIADDDPIVHESLKIYLEAEGFKTVDCYDGISAVASADSTVSLCVLDIMMPGKSGIDVCREIRKTSQVPIVMLTAKGEEVDKIVGLELGADDYIVKPFSAREVVARVKAVLRRFSRQEEEPNEIIRYGSLEININNYDVRLDGERIALTPKEVEIFQLLASHPGKVYSREKILSLVWGYDYFGDTRAVDTQIKRIRQKLPQEGVNWAIKTVYGVGYRFEVYGDED